MSTILVGWGWTVETGSLHVDSMPRNGGLPISWEEVCVSNTNGEEYARAYSCVFLLAHRYVLMWGGKDVRGELRNDMICFDVTSNTWFSVETKGLYVGSENDLLHFLRSFFFIE